MFRFTDEEFKEFQGAVRRACDRENLNKMDEQWRLETILLPIALKFLQRQAMNHPLIRIAIEERQGASLSEIREVFLDFKEILDEYFDVFLKALDEYEAFTEVEDAEEPKKPA